MYTVTFANDITRHYETECYSDKLLIFMFMIYSVIYIHALPTISGGNINIIYSYMIKSLV